MGKSLPKSNIAAKAKIKDWLMRSGLQLADEETEGVFTKSKKSLKGLTGISSPKTPNSLRYLGVMVDARLNFKARIKKTCGKMISVSAALDLRGQHM